MDKKTIKKLKLGEESPKDDLAYWLSRSPGKRIAEVERLRKECYGDIPRMRRDVGRIIKLEKDEH